MRWNALLTILGIDPGYAIVGYGVIAAEGQRLHALDCGVVDTPAGMPFPERLERIHAGVCELIRLYRPEHVVFEELFFYRNVTTAIQVGAGRGVAILAAQQARLELYEYTPMQIKQAVTGSGHADKKQVQQMVKTTLNLSKVPRPDDAADALAAAICHANTMPAAMEEYRIKK